MGKKNKNQTLSQSPSPKSESFLEQSVLQISASHNSSPLPLASEFESYERTCPGTAIRLLALIEQEQKARHQFIQRDLDLQETHLNKSFLLTVFGQFFSFVILMSCIGGAVYCAKIDQPLASGVLSAIAGSIGWFFFRGSAKKEGR